MSCDQTHHPFGSGSAAWRSLAQLGALFFPSFCSSSDFSRSRSRHLTRAKLQIGMPLLRSCANRMNRWTDERWKKGSPWRSLFSTIHSMTKDADKTSGLVFSTKHLLWIHALKGTVVLSNYLQLPPVSPASPERHLDTNLSWQRSTHVSDCHDSIGQGARLQCNDLRVILLFLLGICLGHTSPLFRFGDQSFFHIQYWT